MCVCSSTHMNRCVCEMCCFIHINVNVTDGAWTPSVQRVPKLAPRNLEHEGKEQSHVYKYPRTLTLKIWTSSCPHQRPLPLWVWTLIRSHTSTLSRSRMPRTCWRFSLVSWAAALETLCVTFRLKHTHSLLNNQGSRLPLLVWVGQVWGNEPGGRISG